MIDCTEEENSTHHSFFSKDTIDFKDFETTPDAIFLCGFIEMLEKSRRICTNEFGIRGLATFSWGTKEFSSVVDQLYRKNIHYSAHGSSFYCSDCFVFVRCGKTVRYGTYNDPRLDVARYKIVANQ